LLHDRSDIVRSIPLATVEPKHAAFAPPHKCPLLYRG
jgi:hypothetical protein